VFNGLSANGPADEKACGMQTPNVTCAEVDQRIVDVLRYILDSHFRHFVAEKAILYLPDASADLLKPVFTMPVQDYDRCMPTTSFLDDNGYIASRVFAGNDFVFSWDPDQDHNIGEGRDG
jgi:hypothetical protein